MWQCGPTATLLQINNIRGNYYPLEKGEGKWNWEPKKLKAIQIHQCGQAYTCSCCCRPRAFMAGYCGLLHRSCRWFWSLVRPNSRQLLPIFRKMPGIWAKLGSLILQNIYFIFLHYFAITCEGAKTNVPTFSPQPQTCLLSTILWGPTLFPHQNWTIWVR